MDKQLNGKNIIVTGGTSGLGKGIVKSLADNNAKVTVIARNSENLENLEKEISNVVGICGDITDQKLATKLLSEINPDVVILNAGEKPKYASIQNHSWESFSTNWNIDVKGTFFWVQEILKLPLKPQSKIIIISSGAALKGSPMSGGYAGAKATQSIIGTYANQESKINNLGLKFYVLYPTISPNTGVGDSAIKTYAERMKLNQNEFIETLGKFLSPQTMGENVLKIITENEYSTNLKYWITGEGLQAIKT